MKNLDKEEFRVKLEEINHLVEQKDYKGAMNVVDSIDWRRVKNVRTFVWLVKSMLPINAMRTARKFSCWLITELHW